MEEKEFNAECKYCGKKLDDCYVDVSKSNIEIRNGVGSGHRIIVSLDGNISFYCCNGHYEKEMCKRRHKYKKRNDVRDRGYEEFR